MGEYHSYFLVLLTLVLGLNVWIFRNRGKGCVTSVSIWRVNEACCALPRSQEKLEGQEQQTGANCDVFGLRLKANRFWIYDLRCCRYQCELLVDTTGESEEKEKRQEGAAVPFLPTPCCLRNVCWFPFGFKQTRKLLQEQCCMTKQYKTAGLYRVCTKDVHSLNNVCKGSLLMTLFQPFDTCWWHMLWPRTNENVWSLGYRACPVGQKGWQRWWLPNRLSPPAIKRLQASPKGQQTSTACW